MLDVAESHSANPEHGTPCTNEDIVNACTPTTAAVETTVVDRDFDSDSTTSSEVSRDVHLPTPPDGGWGWVVVMASFMIHLIADGCAFSFGVLYIPLLDHFGESKGKTAWIGSLFQAVPLMTGPIASALTNKYGCRRVTIVSGIISTLGFIASYFMNSIEGLCFTFGIIAGFGLSMAYVPALVIVAYYFEKHRAFATGVAVAGSGIGTFVFAPITEWLIEVYGWRGAILILGGFMFNITLCGAVFRPLDTPTLTRNKYSVEKCSRLNSQTDLNNDKKQEKLVATGRVLEEMKAPVAFSLMTFPTYLTEEFSHLSPDLLRDMAKTEVGIGGLINDPELLDKYYASKSLDDAPFTLDIASVDVKTVGDEAADDMVTAKNSIDIANGHLKQDSRKRKDLVVWHRHGHSKKTPTATGMQPLIRKDIFYRGNLQKSSLQKTLPDVGVTRAASCPNIIMHHHEKHARTSAQKTKKKVCNVFRFSKEVRNIMTEMLDMAILRNPIFVLFCASNMLLYMWYDVPYIYAPDAATGMGISLRRASLLVSILGIVSTFGQILLGFIGDQPKVNTLLLYSILTTAAGGVTMLVPLLTSYLGLALYAASYGLLISANYGLTTIILVDLLGMEKLTNAYGLVMLAEGVANLFGPPLAGWMSDVTDSYDLTFYISGFGIAISGLMLLAIPWITRHCGTDPRKNRKMVATYTPAEGHLLNGGSQGVALSKRDWETTV